MGLEKFEMFVGHSLFYPDPIITFLINKRTVSIKLEALHSYIDIIYKSKGDKSEESYKAYENLRGFFLELLNTLEQEK